MHLMSFLGSNCGVELKLIYYKIGKVLMKVVKNKETGLQHVPFCINKNRYFFFATFSACFFYYRFVPLDRSWLELILQAIKAQCYDTLEEIYSNKMAQKEF